MEQLDPNANPTKALRRTHRRRMVLSGLVILAAGITLGVAGTLLVVRPAEPRPPDIDDAVVMTLTRFRGELNLTEKQEEQIETILREHFQQLEALRTAARPKIEQVLQDMKTQVSAVLTDKQRTDWQRLTDELERQFHRGMRRGPGGPGGPGRPGEGPRGGGRGDWPPRRPDHFGPGEDGRPWGPRPEGTDPNGGRWMRRPRPDANDVAPPSMEEKPRPLETPPEPNNLP
jgi:hypothetical protein